MTWTDKPGRQPAAAATTATSSRRRSSRTARSARACAGFGKKRGNGAEVQRYVYGKIYNAKAYNACSQMPRLGYSGTLTERADQGPRRPAARSRLAGEPVAVASPGLPRGVPRCRGRGRREPSARGGRGASRRRALRCAALRQRLAPAHHRLHAQLLPVYFREPSVNLGVAGAGDRASRRRSASGIRHRAGSRARARVHASRLRGGWRAATAGSAASRTSPRW